MAHPLKAVFWLMLCALVPCTAWGQAELLVRLADDAPPELTAAFAEGGAKQGVLAPLFEGLAAVQPVFAAEGAGKRGAVPIPAFVLTLADPAAFAAVRARWAAYPGVAYVQPNHRYALDAIRAGPWGESSDVRADGATPARRTADPFADSLFHLGVVRAEAAWAITEGQPTVRVGQIDTGLFFGHPDLAGQVWINPGEDLDGDGRAGPGDFNGIDDDGNGFVDDLHGFDFVDRPASVEQGDFLGRDPDPSDVNVPGGGRGHGTTVAGVLIAAKDNGIGIAGLAPGARLVPLRAFGSDGLGDDDDIAAALVYAADLGLDVVNLSFGDVYISPLMHEAIQYAVARGTVVVASGGNLGGDDPHYPSDYPEVISVAWLNQEGTAIAGRGTHGVGVDLGAPGSFLYTTLLPSPDAEDPAAPEALYGRRSGSSLAAPLVTATVALLRAHDPTLTPAALRSILTGAARDIGAAGWDHRTGAGLLDAGNALRRALPARVEITDPPHDGGLSGGAVPLLGTAVDPSFASYALFYAEGTDDLADDWVPIGGPMNEQVYRGTLGVWAVDDLPEGAYTLRLAVTLRTGRTLEDRRRVFIDRTAPALDVRLFERGLVGPDNGLVVDVATDDLTGLRMELTLGGRTFTVDSDRRARRHGLAWADETAAGGPAAVRLVATNVAGLTTVFDTTLALPARTLNPAYFDEETLPLPHGFLLPRPTDFDRDGLFELTLNQYEDGWIGDTLVTYEWAGDGFRGASGLIANVLPRDVGDSDGDGLLELLTQVSGVSLLLEQPTPSDFPFVTAFIDTTGLANPFDPNAAFGARLTDLDGDGRGEILVHNTKQWRVLEYDGTTYAEVARLENPTGVTGTEIDVNEFQEPEALIDDFDGDGRTDLLVGDSDGDWIVYEAAGDNTFRPVWTAETTRYNAGSRFAKGDFDGDGTASFVTFTQNWTQVPRDREREPDIGVYHVWENAGDDAYVLRHRFAIAGALSRHGSMATADFDGDGRDELVITQAPDLYVIAFEGDTWRVVFHRGPTSAATASGMRSIEMVTADFDGDGAPELIAAGADERLHRFRPNAVAAVTPPQWVAAAALDAGRVRLQWHAPAADSVTVFRAPPGDPLDPLRTLAADTLIDPVTTTHGYALRAWRGGVASPLSAVRSVRPHAPATVADVHYPAPGTVELVFTAPLAAGLRADQFVLGTGLRPDALLMGREGRAVVLRFKAPPFGPATLQWTDVRDAEGTPVGADGIGLAFPEMEAGTLFITGFEVLDLTTVALRFNAPLDPASAADAAHYRLQPAGEVVEAVFAPDTPRTVTLRVAGRVLGATGLETAIVVEGLRGAAGETLAPEGTTVRLVQAATDLAGVYVFPNPYRADAHAPRMMIAGLPAEATIRVLSLSGGLVRVLEEADGDGGVEWDLNDRDGRAVPSGIYLIRVETPDQPPVLRKAAVIR